MKLANEKIKIIYDSVGEIKKVIIDGNEINGVVSASANFGRSETVSITILSDNIEFEKAESVI